MRVWQRRAFYTLSPHCHPYAWHEDLPSLSFSCLTWGSIEKGWNTYWIPAQVQHDKWKKSSSSKWQIKNIKSNMTKRRHVFSAILFSVIPALELESRAMSSIYVSNSYCIQYLCFLRWGWSLIVKKNHAIIKRGGIYPKNSQLVSLKINKIEYKKLFFLLHLFLWRA